MGGGGGGDGDTETTIRYADYVEDKHSAFLDEVQAQRIAAIPNNPFTGYVDIDFADSFFGAGYVISDFPSLYDMYGKFMAGLDVDTLYTHGILDDSINNVAINNRVSQHAIELEDDIIQSASPRFVTGLRDINSVLSSSFVICKAMLETARTKALSKYDAELRHAMLPVATARWQTHLEWNKVVGTRRHGRGGLWIWGVQPCHDNTLLRGFGRCPKFLKQFDSGNQIDHSVCSIKFRAEFVSFQHVFY